MFRDGLRRRADCDHWERSENFASKDDNPLDYVFGYIVGNDVSSRYWQTP
jgi:hypothetical protein